MTEGSLSQTEWRRVLVFECLNVGMFGCLDWKQLGQLVKTALKKCAG